MNTGYVLGAAFGQAFVMILIMFSLCAIAIQGQRKVKLGWQNTLIFFTIALAIMTAINSFIFFSMPSLLTSGEESLLSIVQSYVLPLIVSAGTLLLLWKPKKVSDNFPNRDN